jgi:hypothetical protein
MAEGVFMGWIVSYEMQFSCELFDSFLVLGVVIHIADSSSRE